MGLKRRQFQTADVDCSKTEPQSTTCNQLSHSDADGRIQCDNTVLDRTAALIATGEEPFPIGFPLEVQNYLANAVRKLRRNELLRFVARQIALSIQSDGDATK